MIRDRRRELYFPWLCFLLGLTLGAGGMWAFGRPQFAMPEGARFVGSKKSMIVHTPDCRYGRRIDAENQAWFRTMEEAEKAGFRACKRCVKD